MLEFAARPLANTQPDVSCLRRAMMPHRVYTVEFKTEAVKLAGENPKRSVRDNQGGRGTASCVARTLPALDAL
jgi:hypothetical protein